MKLKDIKTFCCPDSACQELLKTAVARYNLSARAYHRVLKLGRTIADLAAESNIKPVHLQEALQYRPQS